MLVLGGPSSRNWMAPAGDVSDNSDGGDQNNCNWKIQDERSKVSNKVENAVKIWKAERKETNKINLEINENRMWRVIVRDGGRRIRAHADALPRKKQAEEPKWLDENLIILLG